MSARTITIVTFLHRVLVVGSLLAPLEGQTTRTLHTIDGTSPQERVGRRVRAAGDVDGDGRADLLLLASTGARLHSGFDGAPIFTFARDTMTVNGRLAFSSVVDVGGAEDHDRDGTPDVWVAYRGGAFNGVRVFSGDDLIGGPIHEWPLPDVATIEVLTDFDGDGVPDVAAVRSLSSGARFVHILGNPVSPYSTLLPAGVELALTSGDLNGDHLTEVLIGNPRYNSTRGLVVVWNQSGRTDRFAPMIPGFGTGLAVLPDIDLDGVRDFAVGDGADAVYLHSGTAPFPLIATHTVPSLPGNTLGSSLASLGDLDRDGRFELAVSGPLSTRVTLLAIDPSEPTSANFLEARANLGFSSDVELLETLGDVNGDGLEDFALGTPQTDIQGIVAAGRCEVRGFGRSLAPLSDGALFDGDADSDLDLFASLNPTSVAVYRNIGRGPYRYEPSLTPGSEAVVGARFGFGFGLWGRGAASVGASSDKLVLVETSPASPQVQQLVVGAPRPVDVAAGDLDGDQVDEILVACEGTLFGTGAAVKLTRYDSMLGEYAPPTDLNLPSGKPVQVEFIDLDGDGDPDPCALVHDAPDRIWLYENTGSATPNVGSLVLPSSGAARALTWSDLDGDGDLDLAVVMNHIISIPAVELQVWLYTGSGPLTPSDFTALTPIDLNAEYVIDAQFGELDDQVGPGGALRRDLAYVDSGRDRAFAWMGFDPVAQTFDTRMELAAGLQPSSVVLGDIDSDGRDEAVVTSYRTGGFRVTDIQLPVQAQVQRYGSGCAGTGGLVPTIGSNGTPTLGSGFGLTLDQALPLTPALILIGMGSGEVPLLPSPCSLWIDPWIDQHVRFTGANGRTTFGALIPSGNEALGVNLYFQWAVLDPVGAFSVPGTSVAYAFSDALRIQIGN